MLIDKEAVIFDLDGTLIDSMWLWESIDIEYLGRFGYTIPDGLQKKLEGMSFSETANYFKDRFSIGDSVESIKNEWNNMAMEYYKTRVPLKSGVYEFLTYLKRNKFKLAIATSNSRELALAVLDALHIEHLFDNMVTGCEVLAGKPAPYIYLKAAKNIQVAPERCLVFEDVPMGIMAGKSAGMQVCAVEDEYSSNMKEEKISLSDYYIHDFHELLERWS